MLHSLDDLQALAAGFELHREYERSSGLPWGRSVADLAAANGVAVWRGFDSAIPVGRALGLNVEFRHGHRRDRAHYPTSYFEAEVNVLGEYRKNHAWTIKALSREFGRPPRMQDVSNCLSAMWEFGLFAVTIHSFIPEKSRFGRNDLYDNNPDLWLCSKVTVESRLLGYRDPDPTIELSDGFAVDAAIGRGDFLTNRLLPAAATRDLPEGNRCVWRDAGRVGVANRWASVVVQRSRATKVTLEECTPARGGGSSSIVVNGVTLLTNPQWEGFRKLAPRVAEFFGLPLSVESQPDE